jgi:histidinol phosphatase-like enzyme
MVKLLLTDKDGTLVVSKKGVFIQEPDDQVIKPGSLEIIKKFIDDGWVIVVVSNQGGIENGSKTILKAIEEMEYCNWLYTEAFKSINGEDESPFHRFLFAPNLKPIQESYYKYAHCYSWFTDGRYGNNVATGWINMANFIRPRDARKPSPEMLFYAEDYFLNTNIPVTEKLMIGDRPEDEQAAINAHIPFKHIDSFKE